MRRKPRMRRNKSSRSIFRDLYDVIERRWREGRPRLIQLESLTRRSRTLTRLFQDTLQTWLLATARDDVNAKLESITGRLQLLVSEWEGFEAQREELVVWLADMDARLSEVDQLTGNTCEKLKQLQVRKSLYETFNGITMTNTLGVHRHQKKSGQKYVLSFWTPLRKQEKNSLLKVLFNELSAENRKQMKKKTDNMKMQQNSPTQEKIL
ncbi:uncharacterized protein LOC120442194 [Oreochromis aureus]|uniref:uncharacterized protein LOC120442194 n=1 Tax=Oreochromis aureus TaxID=47969 RepID=UPI001954A9BE|nr:uncharacterized protein LOC120442194 [Oreochromis aureus]